MVIGNAGWWCDGTHEQSGDACRHPCNASVVRYRDSAVADEADEAVCSYNQRHEMGERR